MLPKAWEISQVISTHSSCSGQVENLKHFRRLHPQLFTHLKTPTFFRPRRPSQFSRSTSGSCRGAALLPQRYLPRSNFDRTDVGWSWGTLTTQLDWLFQCRKTPLREAINEMAINIMADLDGNNSPFIVDFRNVPAASFDAAQAAEEL